MFKSSIETLYRKLYEEPIALFTILTTLLTVYGYYCGYEYEKGALIAYRIPDSFISVDVLLIIRAILALAFFIVGLLMICIMLFWLTLRVIKSFNNRILVSSELVMLVFYYVIRYLFGKHYYLVVEMPIAFSILSIAILINWIVIQSTLFRLWILSKINKTRSNGNVNPSVKSYAEEDAIKENPVREQDSNAVTTLSVVLSLSLLLLFMIPKAAYQLGYRNSIKRKIYSVLVNKNHANNYAIVNRSSDFTFALSYRDTVFTDSVLVLNNASLDAIKLRQKVLEFKEDTTRSDFERQRDQILQYITFGLYRNKGSEN